jgi:protein SCO1
MNRRMISAGLGLSLVLPIGVSATPRVTYFGKDVSAEGIGGPFSLMDQNGKRRSLAEFRGEVVLIFFGYTRCPDVCPTTLFRMTEVMKLLGADAGNTQVVWITIDPERDTQALLHNYIPVFDARFIGLRGTSEQTDAMAKAFRIDYRLTEYKGMILVDHSAFGYLIDPAGKTRLKLPYDMPAEQIAADVRSVLQQSRK